MRTITDDLRDAAEEVEREAALVETRRELLQRGRDRRWTDHFSRNLVRREFDSWVGQHDHGSDR